MRASRLFLALLAPFLGAGPAAAAAPLAQHRAVYDLSLANASERSGITGISGRMVYEFRGSACEGYTVRFRYVTKSDTREASQITDQQTTTFEEGDGHSFSFSTKTYTDQSLDKELRGSATRKDAGLEVEIEKPGRRNLVLPSSQFPTQHLVDLIDKAKRGQTFYETTVFDGSEDADKVMITTVVVGRPSGAERADPEMKVLDTLSEQKFWPVDIAYFDADTTGGEDTPDYRISFKLYENGLTRDLEMDYGDFVISGKLVDLAIFETAPLCTP